MEVPKRAFVSMSLLAGLAYSGCGEAAIPGAGEAPPAAPTSLAPPAEPWTLVEPAGDADGVLRVLIYHDMEGLSGQDDPTSFEFGKPLYPAGRELLTGDVNAVIEGLFEGGADEVHVVDGHGSGNPDPDLLLELLDARADMTFRDAPFDAYGDLPEPGRYDAIVVVGMHAKTGSGGFASHTFTLGMDILFNGQSITETELIALSWGRYDTPVIFGSGDDRLAADLATMPWIEFVTVKTATSASTAELRPVDEARADLRAGAARAIRNLTSARAMKLTAPGTAALRAVPPARLDHLEGVPGIDYADGTVTFAVDGFRESYDGVVALIGVATRGYRRLLDEILADHPAGPEVRERFVDLLFERWMDVESGRWTPPAVEDAPSGGRQYHGYR